MPTPLASGSPPPAGTAAPAAAGLRARLAECRAQAAAAVPAIVGAVAAYREAMAYLVDEFPADGDIYEFDRRMIEFTDETGARELWDLFADVGGLIATAPLPAAVNALSGT